MDESEVLEYYHNKGQEDYPDYDPPKKNVICFMFEGYDELELECIEAYDKGWENAKEMAE